jgi:chloramphenicol 3-O-phosphotransferase
LVLLNGAPSTGKSTLARLYAERHPLTLALDLDLLRAMLGGWLACVLHGHRGDTTVE